MYFNKKNKFLHGVMFHHFHNINEFTKTQGSISSDQLVKIIKYIGRNNIINANDFVVNILENKNLKNKVCFTFDDALKCQEKIALPILEDYNIKAFFFVYSDLFKYNPFNIEIIRQFRHSYFKDVNEFYKFFSKLLIMKFGQKEIDKFIKYNGDKIINFRKKFPIYSKFDVEYRFVRDYFLKNKEYNKIINELYILKKFEPKKYFKSLLMNRISLKKLNRLDHEIGLHSHSHPTKIINLNYKEQYKEYVTNSNIIKKILSTKENIISMSHPCGSYNKNTLRVLKKIGVSIGFKESMLIDKNMKKINNSNLEIARVDHSSILKSIK